MPLYEYYCRTCAVTFELLRPMAESTKAAACPEGHKGADRTVSLFARAGVAGEGGGGGCAGCGGGSCAGCSAR